MGSLLNSIVAAIAASQLGQRDRQSDLFSLFGGTQPLQSLGQLAQRQLIQPQLSASPNFGAESRTNLSLGPTLPTIQDPPDPFASEPFDPQFFSPPTAPPSVQPSFTTTSDGLSSPQQTPVGTPASVFQQPAPTPKFDLFGPINRGGLGGRFF